MKTKYWIDPKKFVVTEFQLFDEKNELQLKLEYKQFEKKNRVVLPKLIQLSQPKQKTRVTILYTSRTLNSNFDKKDFVLKIPEQAIRIQL